MRVLNKTPHKTQNMYCSIMRFLTPGEASVGPVGAATLRERFFSNFFSFLRLGVSLTYRTLESNLGFKFGEQNHAGDVENTAICGLNLGVSTA